MMKYPTEFGIEHGMTEREERAHSVCMTMLNVVTEKENLEYFGVDMEIYKRFIDAVDKALERTLKK